MRPRRALLGVSDRTGLVELAAGLAEHQVELVATGGTEQVLRAAGLAVTPLSELTGMAEMLDGRVKTLHPAIHAGILARRDDADHMAQLVERGFTPIDMVVVNLYPFSEVVAAGGTLEQAVEAIDIGGPTLLRAAAKNWRHVAAVSSCDQYQAVLTELEGGALTEAFLAQLAVDVFRLTSAYDALIAEHLGAQLGAASSAAPEHMAISGRLRSSLRYGENPHQRASLYTVGPAAWGLAGAEQLQGGELSYTNWLDADSAWRLVSRLPGPGAVVIKHTNPCGAAIGATQAAAFQSAYSCDPRSAYGGVVGINRPLDEETAAAIARHFLELVVAPAITAEGAARLAPRTKLRVLRVPEAPGPRTAREVRSVDGGVLVQDSDPGDDDPAQFQVVSQRQPTPAEWEQLRLAWLLVAGVKSNAIVLCREGMAVGIGAGQMSRVEAIQLAIDRAGDRASGSCLASDAFFPMADNLELAAEGGITAAIHPGGSIRDQEVVAVADREGMALVATGRRHFRH
ncbi:MAG: bifunctional phosphoribosylaminoimidazolecarboxamide formyltransferase/IMP cyclohydrolase [Candidatus Dormibacteria bacterium]